MSGWADFATHALNALGRSAPWVVIASLSAFGVYKLQELNQINLSAIQTIAEKERTQARNDFSVANQALKDTYESANKLYTAVLTSMADSLKELRELETEVRDKQKAAFESQIEAEREKSNLRIQEIEIDKTKQQLDNLRAELDSQREIVEKLRRDAKEAESAKEELQSETTRLSEIVKREKLNLDRTTDDLETTKRLVTEKRNELNQAIERLSDASGLIDDIANLPNDPPLTQIADLRRRARLFSASTTKFLRDYLENPERRTSFDPSPLVGLNLTELGASIRNLDGFHWFISIGDSFKDVTPSVSLIGIPDDAREHSYIPSSIEFEFSKASTEQIDQIRNNPISFLSSSTPISSAHITPRIVFSCVDTNTFFNIGEASISKRSWRFTYNLSNHLNSSVFPLVENQKNRIFMGRHVYLLKGSNWNLKLHTPKDVWNLTPDFAKELISRSNISGPIRCLQFYRFRTQLASVEFIVEGLSDRENRIILDGISNRYRNIFNDTQDFSGAHSIFSSKSNTDAKDTGRFISRLARTALFRMNTSSESPVVVKILAQKSIDDLIKLSIENPPINDVEDIGRSEPLEITIRNDQVLIVTDIRKQPADPTK